MLACPHCGEPLRPGARALRCADGHAFDLARQGYVNLLAAEPRSPGDTAAMVQARAAFLRAGHYAPIVDAVAAAAAAALADGPSGGVVDVGAGTGDYLAAVLEAPPAAGRAGLALDVSKHAARRAARAHPRAGAAVADVWRSLPVRTGSAALALDVFSPRDGPELRRILHAQGTLLVVTPSPDHLRELVEARGLLRVDERKEQRLERTLGEHFVRATVEPLAFELRLAPEDAANLVAMGPSAWHAAATTTAGDEPVTVTASVTLRAFRPRP